MGVNVFRADNSGKIFPIRLTKVKTPQMIRLLQITDEQTTHYVLITNFSKLVRSQVTKRNERHYFCDSCLHGCTSQEILDKHIDRCNRFRAQRVTMPEKDQPGEEPTGKDKLKFTKKEHQMPLPFVIYADFESVLEKVEAPLPNPTVTSTTAYQKHKACGAAYKIVSTDPRFYHEPVILRSSNCVRDFLDCLMGEVELIREYLRYLNFT